jgi:hypothetical protein
MTVTITQAASTGEAAYTTTQTAGTLGSVALGIGTLSPSEGTLEWVDGNDTTMVSGAEYTWKFTPTDTNYAELTGTAVPYILRSSRSGDDVPSTSSSGSSSSTGSSGGSSGSSSNTGRSGGSSGSSSSAGSSGGASGSIDSSSTSTTTTDSTETIDIKQSTDAESLNTLGVDVEDFTDLDTSAYYYDAVDWAVAGDLTTGTSEKTFSPEQPCTRAQVITFLWRLAGKPEATNKRNAFSDVHTSDYSYNAVAWAVENNITTGATEHTFAGNDTVSRAQLVTLLWRAAGSPVMENTENPFTDLAEDAYYYQAVLWAVENGITTGMTETTFAPENACTRGQTVTFLYRDSMS